MLHICARAAVCVCVCVCVCLSVHTCRASRDAQELSVNASLSVLLAHMKKERFDQSHFLYFFCFYFFKLFILYWDTAEELMLLNCGVGEDS